MKKFWIIIGLMFFLSFVSFISVGGVVAVTNLHQHKIEKKHQTEMSTETTYIIIERTEGDEVTWIALKKNDPNRKCYALSFKGVNDCVDNLKKEIQRRKNITEEVVATITLKD